MWQCNHDARREDQFEEDQFEADSIAQPLISNSGFGIGAQASVPRGPPKQQANLLRHIWAWLLSRLLR
jgi:hypothetical protein